MFSSPSASQQVISVTKLNRLAKQILESEIGRVWVSGEISNFVAASSGHWYFSLKDNKAQVRCAMFKGSNRHLRQQPKAGDKVIVRASISLYEARGDYQLIAEHLEPEGLGQLKQAFEALKQELAAQGLFAQERKRPLPDSITRIGVVTSPTGAAIHDILQVLARRNPSIQVIIYPCLVQGEQAAPAIARQILLANQRNEVDVLIVGRGGGSLEDLWAFNERAVALSIAQSNIVTIAAVGHEVDVTIADYVADLRASTPSAAAELVSADKQQLMIRIDRYEQQLMRAIQAKSAQATSLLALNYQRLLSQHPKNRLHSVNGKLDNLQARLIQIRQWQTQQAQEKLRNLQRRLANQNPQQAVSAYTAQHTRLQQQLTKAMQQQLGIQSRRLAGVASMLNAVSPLATIGRGYSITFSGEQIVKQANQISVGQALKTRIQDADVYSEVLRIDEH